MTTTPAIPCGNLQNFFATLSNNTLDFNMYLQNTLQLNNQVQSFIKSTFKSIGLEKIIVPSLHYDAPEMFKGDDLDLLKSKAMEATPHRQKSLVAIQPYEKKPLVKRSELIQKKIKQEQMDSYVRMPQGYQELMHQKELKRMASDQFDAYAKVEDQYHISKKMKTQYSQYNHYETGSETSSNGSPGYNEFYIKQEDYSELARRQAPIETDHPVKVLGVKVDKQTKATWYLVEWQQRRDGVKPINSYIRKEDVPKESYHLVANFFERQLISKMAA